MSKNNTIRKSDKKFIRREKARIRVQFLDVKKQEEMVTELYKKFLQQPEAESVKEAGEAHKEVKVQSAKVKTTTQKSKTIKPKLKNKNLSPQAKTPSSM